VDEFIQIWAQAIAQFEGYNTSGSVANRNNNPGNLKYAGQAGATGQDAQGFAIFPDANTGWQALYNQLNAYVQEFPGYSLLQMMAHYLGQPAPTSDSQGNAYTYANYVASQLGVSTSTTLAQLASAPGSAAPADGGTLEAGITGDGDGTSGGGGSILPYILGGIGLIWFIRTVT
jgi:hypothetical protein